MTAGPNDSRRDAIEDDDAHRLAMVVQVRLHKRMLPVSLGGAAVVALVIVARMAGHVDFERLAIWAIALVVAQSLGFRSAFESVAPTLEAMRRWQLHYRIGFVAHGFAWLLGGLILNPLPGTADHYLLIVALAAMASGALLSAGLDLSGASMFASQATLPLLLQVFVRGDKQVWPLGILLLAFVGYSALSGWRHSRALHLAEIARQDAAKHARDAEAAGREVARIEEVVRENDRRFRDFTDSATDWYWETDAQARFTYFSDNYARIFGCPADEVIGKSRLDFLANDTANSPEVIAAHADVLRRREPFHEFEYLFRFGNAAPAWMSVNGVPFFDADGQFAGYRGTGRIITERKRAEVQLAQALDAAESASRAKSEFLASMSHELRTPLNAILGYAQLFASDEQLSCENRELAGEIQNAGEHLLALVNDLIDLARIEAGRLELSVETVAVEDAIAESMALVAPQAKARQIVVTANYSGGDTAHAGGGDGADAGDGEGGDRRCTHVMADYVRLRQVLVNFLSNAIKYHRVGGKVEIVCRRVGDKARLEVIDNGPGIALDKQERLFNAFDRLGAEGGSVEGTGIGLVIAKRIIEAMGGAIGFASEPGHGSRFWVDLRIASGEAQSSVGEAAASSPARSVSPTSPSSPRPVVLYVEDNPVNLKLMQRIFERRDDLELRSAPDAEQGIVLARALHPALIVLDINLPGMDGYAALGILKNDPELSSIPVVALTANALDGDVERGRQAGFDAYLTKPIGMDAMMLLLDERFAVTT